MIWILLLPYSDHILEPHYDKNEPYTATPTILGVCHRVGAVPKIISLLVDKQAYTQETGAHNLHMHAFGLRSSYASASEQFM